MTPARWDDQRPAPQGSPSSGSRSGRLGQVLWAAVPVVSVGFLSFVPFLAYAVMKRTARAWALFAAYLAATVAMIVTLGAVNSSSSGSAAVGGFVVALAGCAAINAAVLFRPGRGQPPTAAGAPAGIVDRNREAVLEAKSRIERRKDARHLVQSDPGLARDLCIGRPDLPRDYDDGGLVDVNHVPGPVLAEHLGLSQAEMADVLAARDKLGRFSSADELCAYTSLAPDRVDGLRDLMIFS
jgi:hypothetical protein